MPRPNGCRPRDTVFALAVHIILGEPRHGVSGLQSRVNKFTASQGSADLEAPSHPHKLELNLLMTVG
jgi:hypothetical protein